MQYILTLFRGLSISAVLSAIIFIIVPDERDKRFMRSVFCVFLVYTVISTVTQFSLNNKGPITVSADKYQTSVKEGMNNFSVLAAENEIKQILKDYKMDYEKIEVKTDISDNNRIFISEVNIQFDGFADPVKEQAVYNTIRQKINVGNPI